MALTFAISWKMGASCEMSEMPAEVLRKSSSQRAHHCQVASAVAERVIGGGALCDDRGLRRPALRFPSSGRILHHVPGSHGDDEVGDAKVGECLQYAHGLNEVSGYRRGDQRSRAESADGDAGDETAAIGKPFEQNRNGHDVAEAQSDAADDSVGEIEPPEFVGGETGEKDAKSIKESAGEGDDARAATY